MAPLFAQVVVQAGFEDGTAQGWIPRGGVTLAATTEAAASGTHSLKTTGRTQGFHGPSLNVLPLLQRGATYRVELAVRLGGGEPASGIRVTMQRTPMGEANRFEQIAASTADVTDSAWVKLQGLYTFAGENAGLLLYVESPNPTVSFLIDDFAITMLAPPPGPPEDTSGLATNFESNSVEGWSPRIGRESVTVTGDDKHGGEFSLLVAGRQRPFDGAKIDVTRKMANGSRFRISVWAKLAPGEEPANLRVSLERTFAGVQTFATAIPNTRVTDSQWTRLSAVYDVAFAFETLSLYVETADGTASYLIDDFELSYVPPVQIQNDIPSVHETLAAYFPVGAAVWQGSLLGPQADLLRKHFSSVTADNSMKVGPIHPAEDTYAFAVPDSIAAFARTNRMKMRGHTLVWHEQNPAWLFRDSEGNELQPGEASKALMLDRLRAHIRAVVTRYKDDVSAWDVVNEAIDPSQADCMRRTAWYRLTGTEYIDVAFQTAREIAPEAKLFYNDYDTTNPARRRCMVSLVASLRDRGIPVDGMGHQMHVNIDYPAVAAVVDTINEFAALGVENHITEMDMSVYNNPTASYDAVPEAVIIRQGHRYREFFDAFRELAGKVTSVTFWGMADDYTWLKTFPIPRLDLPLLFDEQLQAKPAYWGVVDPSRLPPLP